MGSWASDAVAFIGLGSNAPDAREQLQVAVGRLLGDDPRVAVLSDSRVAALSWPVEGPYESAPGRPDAGAPPVLNAVLEIRTPLDAGALLERLRSVEAALGRVRDGSPVRSIDLDLLDHEHGPSGAAVVPHPRALERAFVLGPWEEIAPLHRVGPGARPVTAWAGRLRARDPDAFARLARRPRLEALEHVAPPPAVLGDAAALAAWRGALPPGAVLGLVPTMGALHEGHASLLRRARAGCDVVLATLFVNPLQFGPGEDLARYPRTFDEDLALLRREGTDAVYAPSPDDLYPPGFSTRVHVDGPSGGLEGEVRPGHFDGVATVVHRLWGRTRPDRTFLGQKDAQQVAVLRRLAADLEMGGRIVVGATVRDEDGLALSSRNRYLSLEERARARALPAALGDLALEAARGAADPQGLVARARERLVASGLGVDYVAIVDPVTMEPAGAGPEARLVVAAARAGATRLLDNRWISFPEAFATR